MDEFHFTPKTRSTPVKIPFLKSKFDPNVKIPLFMSPINSPKMIVPPTTPITPTTPPVTPIITPEEKKEKVKEKVEEKKEKVKEKVEEKKVKVTPKSPPSSPKKVVKVPKYELMTEEEKDKEYNKFETKFDLLRKYLKGSDTKIPELDRSLPLSDVNKLYNKFIKNVQINDNTGKYKVYMVILWLFIEYACTKIGLNVGGYTLSQMKAMEKYEILLIKLGEKNYKYQYEESNQWPVEFDILFMALINAIAFIIIKMLCESINMDPGLANTIVDTISNYLSGSQQQPNVLFNESSAVPMAGLNGLDLPNIVANLGNMFLNKKPAEGKTPQFKPKYED